MRTAAFDGTIDLMLSGLTVFQTWDFVLRPYNAHLLSSIPTSQEDSAV
jgi:hypothetical protein